MATRGGDMCCRQAGSGGRDGRNIRRSPTVHFVVPLSYTRRGGKKKKSTQSISLTLVDLLEAAAAAVLPVFLLLLLFLLPLLAIQKIC